MGSALPDPLAPPQVVYHERHIHSFWGRLRGLFLDAQLVGPEENLPENKARNMAV